MRSISILLGLGVLVGALVAGGCASSVTVPATLQAITLVADRDAEVEVVCGGKVAYRLFMYEGRKASLPFEEGRCELRSKEPVRLVADVEFK